MEPTHYCHNPYHYQRRVSREVKVGKVGIGGANPIRVQSMLTCDTMNTRECVQQTLALVAVGCEIVRITAPTVKDAANLKHIKSELLAAGCDVPLVADIHFKPDAAMEAAQWVEKVRVNPATSPTRRSSPSANTPTTSTTRNSPASTRPSSRWSISAASAASPCASAPTTARSPTGS